jgi:dipeptide/tripeptide permease
MRAPDDAIELIISATKRPRVTLLEKRQRAMIYLLMAACVICMAPAACFEWHKNAQLAWTAFAFSILIGGTGIILQWNWLWKKYSRTRHRGFSWTELHIAITNDYARIARDIASEAGYRTQTQRDKLREYSSALRKDISVTPQVNFPPVAAVIIMAFSPLLSAMYGKLDLESVAFWTMLMFFTILSFYFGRRFAPSQSPAEQRRDTLRRVEELLGRVPYLEEEVINASLSSVAGSSSR